MSTTKPRGRPRKPYKNLPHYTPDQKLHFLSKSFDSDAEASEWLRINLNLHVSVSPAGSITVHGLGRFRQHFSMFPSQWLRLFDAMPAVLAFIAESAPERLCDTIKLRVRDRAHWDAIEVPKELIDERADGQAEGDRGGEGGAGQEPVGQDPGARGGSGLAP